MQPPRRLRPLTKAELSSLTVERLLAYRKKALSLENTPADSDYHDHSEPLDEEFIWFKEDPRWQPVYDEILAELARKQSGNSRTTKWKEAGRSMERPPLFWFLFFRASYPSPPAPLPQGARGVG